MQNTQESGPPACPTLSRYMHDNSCKKQINPLILQPVAGLCLTDSLFKDSPRDQTGLGGGLHNPELPKSCGFNCGA